MGERLKRSFYIRPTLLAAKDLLGKYLVRKIGDKKLVGKIVETEAYIGPEDKASHAYGGKITPRNQAEFLIGGHIYIYLVYGMYWQFNISTGQAGKPECVLIRALEPILGCGRNPKFKILNPKPRTIAFGELRGRQIQNSNDQNPKLTNLANGPGKLCRWMRLDKSFYGEDLTKSKKIWLESGDKIKTSQIIASKRIGIDYAGKKWASKPRRFYIKNSYFVS